MTRGARLAIGLRARTRLRTPPDYLALMDARARQPIGLLSKAKYAEAILAAGHNAYDAYKATLRTDATRQRETARWQSAVRTFIECQRPSYGSVG